MVLLTMTPFIVEALTLLETPRSKELDKADSEVTSSSRSDVAEPLRGIPEVGNPIAHGQIVDLWKRLKSQDASTYSLEQLLRGAHIYIPPPPPKPKPSPEYSALMARLRREEEARSYDRMVNSIPHLETFQDRFPTAHAFAEVNKPSRIEDLGDDEITNNEVHRQVTLILNFLISIAGVAGTLWVAARWWSTPSRLFLTLGGSILVAIAEVIVYNGYMWRMGEARKKQDGMKEVKQVVETWVVGQGDEKTDEKMVLIKEKTEDTQETVRKRNIEARVET